MELTEKPRRTSGPDPKPSSDGTLTITTPDGEVVQLNPTAAALWALCDGRTSVEEIVGAATSFFAGEHRSIEHDILGLLDQLIEASLLEIP